MVLLRPNCVLLFLFDETKAETQILLPLQHTPLDTRQTNGDSAKSIQYSAICISEYISLNEICDINS